MSTDNAEECCIECEYESCSPFSEPCVSCGFGYSNFKPREMNVGIILDDDGF